MNKYLKVIVLYLVIFLGLINISSAEENEVRPSVQYDEIYDPIEPINRAFLCSTNRFAFSMTISAT